MNSIRELARYLGLSHTTVSDALRNNPRVKAETRKRVIEAAERKGYRYNPLAGALMSEMRKKGAAKFKGVIAVVDLESTEQRFKAAARFHKLLREGAKENAENQGFKTEVYELGKVNLTISRLESILRARGIRGLLILPSGQNPDISALNWDCFAGVYLDYIIDKPALDTVCPNHFRSMMLAMSKIQEHGYKRPGLVLIKEQEQRLLFAWEAAFRMFNLHQQGFDSVEPYIVADLQEDPFKKWFQANQPDIILCHRFRVKRWMESMGLKIPGTHGFCSLNVVLSPEPMSGIDLCPRRLGQRGMELLIGKLHRNDYGIPEFQLNSMIPPQWIDGPTMRMQSF